MVGTKDFNWRGTRLYLGRKSSGFRVDNLENIDQWRVIWPDGVKSEDYYNLSRAKEHCISEASVHFNTSEFGAARGSTLSLNMK